MTNKKQKAYTCGQIIHTKQKMCVMIDSHLHLFEFNIQLIWATNI